MKNARPADSPALDPLAAKLLADIADRLARLVGTDLHKLPYDRMAAGLIRAAVQDARRGVLALADLLDGVTDGAQRKAAHRALDRLEAAGRIRRLRLGYDGARYARRTARRSGRRLSLQRLQVEIKNRPRPCRGYLR